MVKINKTLGLALLTALAASCSSDNDVAQSNNPEIENGEAAYATLRIDLPTQPSSPTGRAVEFNDGKPSEYDVKDATLLVFKKAGNSEGDYTFVEKVDLGNNLAWETKSSNGITTQTEMVAKLTSANLTEARKGEYYGLVILNNKKSSTGTDLKVTLPSSTTTTFKAWNVKDNANADNMANTDYSIVMANAPEWTANGVTPLTLVPIDGTKVFANASEAKKAGAAATIHVERGLAKVTIDDKNTTAEKTPTGASYANDKVKISAWTLDVTNRSSFPIHNVDGLKDSYSEIWNEVASNDAPTVNRFHDMTNTFKRVYWGIDPNYDGNTLNQAISLDACKTAFNMVHDMDANGKTAAFKATFGDNNPQYCLENTFDIDNMTQGQTTRVVFKATYTPSGMTAEKTFFKVGTKMYTQADLETYINRVVKELTSKVAGKDYKLNLDNILTAPGKHDLAPTNFTAVASGAKATRADASAEDATTTIPNDEDLKKVNGVLGGITTYLNGECYYIGRIQHFGADTPWTVNDPTYGGSENNSKFLGRYGVLRNNWYNLEVNSIAGPGEPEVPEVVPENPDDEKDVYIDLSVKILQWAKHTTQSLSDL